ncbi:MAG: DEAD/DEAH box helicase [Phycisphaerales bacterium]
MITAPTSISPLHPRLADWFAARGWTPYAFQTETWRAWRAGRSGLVHVPTGAGKTYAAYLGPLGDLLDRPSRSSSPDGLAIVYVTPLRAVSRDIEKALRAPIDDLRLPIRVESRTGDTTTALRAKQRARMPHVLVTTPESLTLLLTRDDACATFAGLRAVIVDEWHELLSSKRGVQTELALARLRTIAPSMRTWALSATLRDPFAAARAAVGATNGPALDAGGQAVEDESPGADGGAAVNREVNGDAAPIVVSATIERPVIVSSVLPTSVDRFPWAGHMGLCMLGPLLEVLDPDRPTLIFTNTRSQSERWFQAILEARPEWARRLALHHGSIDRAVRERIEAGLKDGSISLVVCTSSLDLGVDFSPVQRVVQIGSPKGIARLIQRAGRAGHRPGASCEVICVPTHAFELVEIAAARQAVAAGRVEERPSLNRPLDVLVQHLVTASFGDGFDADQLFAEVRTTMAYRDLAREEFDWCLELVEHGGSTLRAYPEHHRVARRDGRYRVAGRRLAALHRLNVGTITGDATVAIRLVGGRSLGSIEEYFVSRLRAGDVFLFGGRMLEFARLRDMTAFVKPARRDTTFTPHWNGARFPLSTALSAAVREVVESLRDLDPARPPHDLPAELRTALPVVETQLRLSRLPRAAETLIELTTTPDGCHCFIYPFEGRLVHEGLAALLALRLGRRRPATLAMSMNDYGIELLSSASYDFAALLAPELFTTTNLVEDLLEAINLGELAQRQFREVARVAGLVPQKYPGGERSTRQIQAGSSLIYEVFEQFDPQNLLLVQARREVLERQCEESRLARTLRRLGGQPMLLVETARPTPLALPLVADRLGSTLSTESVRQRIDRMLAEHSART